MNEELSSALEETPLVFVYGTLKYGYGNWSWCLRHEEYLGEDVTEDKYLLINAGFPFCYHSDVEDIPDDLLYPVKGDVFEVSNTYVLRDLDMLESEGSLYHRKLINTQQGRKCWMYIAGSYWPSNGNLCTLTDEGEWQWP